MINHESHSIGLDCLQYVLPEKAFSVDALAKQGLLTSSADFLKQVGFDSCYVAEDAQLFTLLLGSAQLTLRKNTDVGLLMLYRGIYSQPPQEGLEYFRYTVSRLQHKLDIQGAQSFTLSEQGCSGVLSMIELAQERLKSSQTDAVLCVAGDILPFEDREVLYNVMSDAACSFIVRKGAEHFRVIASHQITQPYYWDTPKHEQELLAAYFPMAQRAIDETLRKAEVSKEDITWFIPHNVSRRSWEILAKVTGVGEDRIWAENISKYGHTVSCDHIINLKHMQDQGLLKKGDKLMLFTFGFGASWSCLLLEY